MMTEVPAWARLYATARPFCRPTPRTGAWYPVVREIGSRLVIQVAARRVAIARNLLEVRPTRPNRFTVVSRAPEDPNPAKGTSADLGRTYAVCPGCESRIRLFGAAATLTCRQCGHHGDVAWWEGG